MTFRRRNAGVIAHNGSLYVVGGDDGSSNLSNVEVNTLIHTFFSAKTQINSILLLSKGLLSKN